MLILWCSVGFRVQGLCVKPEVCVSPALVASEMWVSGAGCRPPRQDKGDP